MTSDNRSEIEALADCYCCGEPMLDANGNKTWEFNGRGLRELARRLQPARVPEEYAERVLSEYVRIQIAEHDERSDKRDRVDAMRRALAAAARAAEGGKPVAWRIHWSESDFAKPELTDDAQRVAKVAALENPPKIVPLGVIATPAPESREAPKCADCGNDGSSASAGCHACGETKPEAGQREGGSGNTLEWLGKTDAGFRLACMLRDDVKPADFRSTLTEVIRLASAQQDGSGSVPDATDDDIGEWLERHDIAHAIRGSDARAAFEDAQSWRPERTGSRGEGGDA